ncbi:MAG TPA: serine/threonine protein kinase [Planctomycetaceae bacterium]|nr:serine/threonine protein kinase [Planctomycetaceae bacterium]
MLVADVAGSYFRLEHLEAPAPEWMPTFSLPVTLGGFELVEELGRGGMGVVYRATQQSLNREVALKMILPGRLASQEQRDRFQHEAEAAARLDHPGIVPVYEVGELEDCPYFSMKLIQGETITTLVQQELFAVKKAAKIVTEVARAIHYSHNQGILHRDLKPSNILIDQQGHPHITDFGLAKHSTRNSELTQTGAILGTPSYMAPEQAAGSRGNVGVPSDIYSLGAMLYYMVTGRPPFQAASAMDTIMMVLEQEPVAPRTINPAVDRDLDMIIMKCLQKPADLRYSSARELADDLDAFLTHQPIQASSGRFGHVVARWLGETHHASVLQNWGVLWMWHSLVLLLACVLTNIMFLADIENRLYYSGMWTLGLGTWAAVFWMLRQKLGPVLFVERQIAHAWAASMIAIGLLFPIEYLMGLEVLEAAPVIGLISGMVFMVKAGILTGKFYSQSFALFATSVVMAMVPKYSLIIFGVVSAICFFVPGYLYHQQKTAR